MDPRTLRSELERLRGRLRSLFVLYGSLRLLAIVAAIFVVLFLLDRTLTLPSGVRLLFLAGAALILGFFTYRGVVYPLRRKIRAEDVACAVEERFPEFDGRLLSTLELEGRALDPDRNVSVELVNVMRAETAGLVKGVRFEQIFDYRHLRRLAGVAALLLVVVVGYGLREPHLAGIFLKRLVGADVRWPQRVFLTVEFPGSATHFQVEEVDGYPVRVKVARGASLPVTVRARGENPSFVELRTRSETGRVPTIPLAPTAGSEWVGRFRNVREDFTFFAHDGDSNDDGLEVSVEVFAPPAVQALVTVLTFPRYTGLEPRREERGDVEAPEGTRVDVELTLDGDAVEGSLRFDGATGPVDLKWRPGERAPAGDDGAFAAGAWVGSFTVTESTSYSVNLTGSNGFTNLEPATYAVIAVKDRAPTVRLIEPSRVHVEVTPEAFVPFRVAADDDYGIRSMRLAVLPYGLEKSSEFDLLAGAQDPSVKRRIVYTLVDLSQTAFEHVNGPRAAQVGDSYVYSVAAEDNLEVDGAAAPHRTEVSGRRVDVVSMNEKMRLLIERQIRLKDDVRSLRELQAEKSARLKDVLSDYEASEGDRPPEADDLAAVEIGQNQVTNRATRLCREFGDLFEEYLLNRIDQSAAADRIVPALAERKRASEAIDGFEFAIYRPLVDGYQKGDYGKLDVVGRLLDMVACILDVSESLSPSAAASMSAARILVDPRDRPTGIGQALAHQESVLRRLDELLEKMDEWEDFQEILTLFTDLLEDQRNLNGRTRNALRSEGR